MVLIIIKMKTSDRLSSMRPLAQITFILFYFASCATMKSIFLLIFALHCVSIVYCDTINAGKELTILSILLKRFMQAMISGLFFYTQNPEKYELEFSSKFGDYIRNDNVGSERFLHLLEVMERENLVLDDIPNALNVSETYN